MRREHDEVDETEISPSQYASFLAKKVGDKDWFSFWGEVGELTCEQAGLFLLNKLFSGTKMVTLFICSPGGSEDDLRGLLSIMEHCKSLGMVIRGIGAGVVASAAFDLFIACSPGWRFVFEATMLMTHSSAGHVEDEDMYELQRRFDMWTLKKYTNIHASTRRRFMKTGNWWFDPEAAVGYGAADHVIMAGEEIPEEPKHPRRKSAEEQRAEAAKAISEHDDDEAEAETEGEADVD